MPVKVATSRLNQGTTLIRWANPPINALSSALCSELKESINEAKKDPGVLQLVLYAANNLPFSGGADIREFDAAKTGNVAPLATLIEEIEDSTIPIIALTSGFVLGGGLELALACHYRLAESRAQFGLPEVKLGLLPGCGGTQRLPRLIGFQQALRMIVTGQFISTSKALETGLVDQVLEGSGDVALLDAAMAFIEQHSPLPLRRTRDMQVSDVSEEKSAMEISKQVKKGLRVAPLDKGGEAQEACIEATVAAGSLKFEEGLALETRLFRRLLRSSQSRARRYNFLAERQTSLDHHPESYPLRISRIGVIGGGTTGSGIVVSSLMMGAEVILIEANESALHTSMQVVRGIVMRMVQRGQLSQKKAMMLEQRFKGSLRMTDLDCIDLAIEAVFEDMQLKQDIFRQLDKICHVQALLCSNTSSLSIDEIASVTRRPQQVLGMHFFSPTHIMRLIELVRGKKTSTQAIATLAACAKAMHKVCVVVDNCHGFVGNRMLFPYKLECELLVEEGASPYQVDRVLIEYGFPIGPFQMADLAGLDISLKIRRAQGLLDISKRDARIRHADVGDELCENTGRLGQKNGRGWYLYEGRSGKPDAEVLSFLEDYRDRQGQVPRTDITDREILQRCLYAMVNEGFRCLEEHIASRPSDIDVIWVQGYSWPVWRGGPMYWAETEVGLPTLLAELERLALRFPRQPHLQPSPLLRRLVRQGQHFIASKL